MALVTGMFEGRRLRLCGERKREREGMWGEERGRREGEEEKEGKGGGGWGGQRSHS